MTNTLSGRSSAGLIVVWSMAGFSIIQIIWILTFSIRDIIKSTQLSYVLKDRFTVYYVVYILIGLSFKVLVLDSYYKDYLDSRKACSNFVSEYIPHVFVILTVAVAMFKIQILSRVSWDTLESYKKFQKYRVNKSLLIFRVIQVIYILFLILRAVNTCSDQKYQMNFMDFDSYIQYSIFTIFKLFFYTLILISLIKITRSPNAQEYKKLLYFFIVSISLIALAKLVCVILLLNKTLEPSGVPFEAVFFADHLMIIVLTILMIKSRYIELNILLRLGVFKNVDEMTDKEMFFEYDKMRKQSYVMKRRYPYLIQQNRQNRVSINDNENNHA
ncbi:UNKNOWN [Stylonychia lemnae]|uniref:Uncharacterized protein n=1 Tax=Stylonychia lemnae TaxID=5949 RepID=A0A078AIH2_STYLE|nr:UNKNOWN [Stylonychia lemnae]|eukprot:CDW82050.1 UNKNOWN [Stylonychia lemnae]